MLICLQNQAKYVEILNQKSMNAAKLGKKKVTSNFIPTEIKS